MSNTFKEQLDLIQKLKRELAVWEAIHHMVDEKFISKDGRKASGLRIPGAEDLVPEDQIEDVLENIFDGPITNLKQKIEELENTPILVVSDSKAKA